MRLIILLATLLAATTLVAPSPSRANTNIVFILDASNSMWGRIDGEPKIVIAKRVLAGLLQDLDESVRVGVLAYGHRRGKDDPASCDDIGVISVVGNDSRAEIVRKIEGIQPMGQTPLTAALGLSLPALKDTPEMGAGDNHVVLISDGLESCGGDPCEVAGFLASRGIKPRLHVVGFDVSQEDSNKLQCIAQIGNGEFLTASNSQELQNAFAAVQQVAEAAAQAPASTYEAVWQDSFDGNDLSADWEVVNPNPDAYLVEDGSLLLVAAQAATPASEAFQNIIQVQKELPQGDWRLTARIRFQPQVGVDRLYLGVRDDHGSWVAAVAEGSWYGACCGNDVYLKIAGLKFSGGKETRLDGVAMSTHNANATKLSQFIASVPALLRIEKKGRQYIASIKVEATEDQINAEADWLRVATDWVVTPELTMLRSPKRIFVSTGLYKEVQGESLTFVDDIVLEVLTPQ